MTYVYIITAFISAMVLSYFILPRIILISYKKNLFDEIDERKVHTKQIPRLGGVSFPLIIILTLLFVTGISYAYGDINVLQNTINTFLEFCFLICGMMLLFMIGIADDLIGVGPRSKLAAQIVAASFFPISGLYISDLGGLFNIYEVSPWVGIPLTIFLVVYITNAINLIDGIDGLASGIAGIALTVAGIFFLIEGAWIYALLSFTVLGLLIPFFYFNVFGNPDRYQKLFMGDTGSLTLGYVISFLMIHFCTRIPGTEAVADKSVIVVTFATMIVPCFDVIRVVLVRLRNKKSPFEPDRNHIHHKLLLTDCTPRMSMIMILSFVLFFIGSNLFLSQRIVDVHLILIFDVICWIGIHLWLNLRISQCSESSKLITKCRRTPLHTIMDSPGLVAK